MRLLALLLIPAAFAAAQEDDYARGKRIVNAAVEALGGARFLGMQDRTESGNAYSFYREELSGLSVATIYTRYLTPADPPKPNELYVREREAFGKDQDSADIFNEKGGWDVTWRGARPLPDDLLARYRYTTLMNVFYILHCRSHEPGLIFESRGSDVWMNQPVEIVEITDAENRSITAYFNQTTGLPVRQVYVRRDPKTHERFDEETVYSRYREVDGVQWPHTIQRERNGEKIFQMFSEHVSINDNLNDTLFTLPADVKILKKEK